MGRGGVYRFETGSSNELLDIGVLRITLSPGLFSIPRRQNVTQTQFAVAGYIGFDGSNGSEDHCYGAQQCARSGGQRRWAIAAHALVIASQTLSS
jgi:hypothetical protein